MWTVNLLSGALRGSGNFRVPALVTFVGAALLIPASPALIFGFGPVPRLGVTGAGIAISSYYVGAALYLLRYLASASAGVALRRSSLRWRLFGDILKVGFLGGVNAVLPNVTTLVVTAEVGRFGAGALAGYGAASRIDYVLVPILFGVGTAVVTMVGVSVGAGDMARARRIAWTGAVVGFVIAESVGLLLAIAPYAWLHLFSKEPQVLEVGARYLHAVGPAYGALGIGMLLNFTAQGSGRMLWPFLAGTVRMLVAAGLGWYAVAVLEAGLTSLFLIVAAGLLCHGGISAVATRMGLIWPRTATPSAHR